MNVSLTDMLEEFVTQLVEQGSYRSASEVMHEGLRFLKIKEAQLQQDLDSGFRKTLKYQDNGEIKKGDFFIVEGQKTYVADWGEQFISSYNKPDRRLRVIYDNGKGSGSSCPFPSSRKRYRSSSTEPCRSFGMSRRKGN